MTNDFRTTPVKRTTVFCRDIEKSLALYRDILRLSIAEDKTITGPAMGRMIGLADCKMRIVHLQSEHSDHGLIGLYAVLEPRLPEAPRPPTDRLHFGQVAVVLFTYEPDVIYNDLRTAGYTFLTPPTKYVKATDGPMMKAGTYTEMLFFDPDGLLVSITGLP